MVGERGANVHVNSDLGPETWNASLCENFFRPWRRWPRKTYTRLAYNLKRVLNLVSFEKLMSTLRSFRAEEGAAVG